MSTKIGTATYSNPWARTNWLKVEAKEPLVVKILPPLGSLADSGRWWVKAAIHFSAFDSNKARHSYHCIKETRKNREPMACPACEKYMLAQTEYNALKAANADLKVLEPLINIMKQNRVDYSYYLNVMDRNGQSGLLRIKKEAKDSLDDLIKKMLAKGMDPIKEGVYFEFSRSGTTFMDTRYSVSGYMERVKVGDRELFDLKREPLTETQIQHITGSEFAGKDLSEIAARLSYDEIGVLMSGNPVSIDRVFGISRRAPQPDQPVAAAVSTDQPSVSNAPPSTLPPTSSPPSSGVSPHLTAAAPPPVSTPTVSPVVPSVQSGMPTAPVPVEAKGTTTPGNPLGPNGSGGVPVSSVEKLSEEDLVKLFKAEGF